MTTERTLCIFKPDVAERGIAGQLTTKIEEKGFKIIAQKKIYLTKPQAEAFYREHALRPFFQPLTTFMSRGPITVIVLEKENCILEYRELIGATKPEEQLPNTIRKLFATSVEENCIHGSDSIEAARREIGFFFSDLELIF